MTRRVQGHWRLIAVVFSFVLLLLGGPLERSTAFLSNGASYKTDQNASDMLRPAASALSGRTSIAAARPAAKKTGAKDPDVALPSAGVASVVIAQSGEKHPRGVSPPPLETAPGGYLARAPPALA